MSAFVFAVEAELMLKRKHNKLSIEKLAASYGITDKTEVKELTELAIVKQARKIAKSDEPLRERYERIVELYHSQVNLSHRTSHSILLQQYSTPAPIGFIAGLTNAKIQLCDASCAQAFDHLHEQNFTRA